MGFLPIVADNRQTDQVFAYSSPTKYYAAILNDGPVLMYPQSLVKQFMPTTFNMESDDFEIQINSVINWGFDENLHFDLPNTQPSFACNRY